jgi:type I site-specific restriction endonuclease
MSDRLHEIIAQIGVIHNELIENKKIKDANEVFDYIEDYDNDVREHYLNLLLQYYFQQNDLKNLQEVLLVGAKFDMRFEDVKDAFLNIKSSEENVIEFMEDAVVFIKDSEIENNLALMYDYYQNNENYQVYLEAATELIRRNRYVCAYCFKNPNAQFSEFFLNEDLLESLKRDLPYLLN